MREVSGSTEEAGQRDRDRDRERERERDGLNSDRENDGKDEDAERGFAMTGFVKDQRGWRGLTLLRSISGKRLHLLPACLAPK